MVLTKSSCLISEIFEILHFHLYLNTHCLFKNYLCFHKNIKQQNCFHCW